MTPLVTLDNLLAKVERMTLFVALMGMVGLVAGEVLVRKFWPDALSVITGKGDELARLLMVWAGFIGASLAAKEAKHLAVTIKYPVSEKVRRLMVGGRFLVTALFIGVVALLGWQAFFDKMSQPTHSAAMEYNYAYLYLSIPVTFTLMTFRFLLFSVQGFKGDYVDPEPGHE